tara:strand:- start:2267 stop:2725 length:459 start_codon:yes stop_codon:yes gene_type:complete
MIDILVTLLLFVITGGAGWFATEYVGRQIARFYELRADAIEAIYYVANVGEIALEGDRERYNRASDELRRCAARFDALRKNITSPTRRYLNFRGYDLNKVVEGLTGLSNGLAKYDYPRLAAQNRVEIGLCLVPSHTKEELEEERDLHRQGLK